MKIAFQTRFLRRGFINERGYFIYELFTRIARDHPEHEFLIITPEVVSTDFVFSPGIKFLISGPTSQNYLSSKYWWDIRLPLLLTKNKVDIFFGGDGICSLRTKIPQCILSDELQWKLYPEQYSSTALFFLKRHFPKNYKRADHIFFYNNFIKEYASSYVKLTEEKTSVIYSGADIPQILSEEDKTGIRELHTSGKHFFLSRFTNSSEQIIDLLKSFSLFKKRQQTNMHLLVFISGSVSISLKALLSSYKYREDVVVLSGNELQYRNLLAASYGYIDINVISSPGVYMLHAAVAGVPLILAQIPSNHELAKDAALYSTENHPASFASLMMLLYKNESLRNDHIARGKEMAAGFSWDKTAGHVWKTISGIRVS